MGACHRWGAMGSLFATLLLAACGLPDADRPNPPLADLADYQRRCERLDSTLQRARVVYEAQASMKRGDPAVVAAAVTLDEATPPEQVLRRAGATAEPGFLVSCHVEARLRVSPYEFEVDQADWVDRSLLTMDTARWSWQLTPKMGGTQTIVLQVRPVVKIRDDLTGTVSRADPAEASIAEFETKVDVAVPWTERPQETLSRLAAMFQVAEGAVVAATGLVIAVGGLLSALGVRMRRRKRKDGEPSTDEPAP
ncbi:hypothetical protein [Phytohabitans rumicis]|uniref:Lipoprotein n=1 Tax=Phytohabitans rumicis TaxID=1076125 RepID=A0A6V8L5J7_9ACTN|nr:hypothetical protein [Phytohabitans rumicis]GFJ89396.1 hypothetical protein Prum_030380 [Phytohabitans rumicis]